MTGDNIGGEGDLETDFSFGFLPLDFEDFDSQLLFFLELSLDSLFLLFDESFLLLFLDSLAEESLLFLVLDSLVEESVLPFFESLESLLLFFESFLLSLLDDSFLESFLESLLDFEGFSSDFFEGFSASFLLFSFSLLLLDEEPLSFDDFEGDFAGELDLFGVEFPLVDGELVRGFLAGLVEEDLEELFDGVEAFFLPLDSSSALDLLLALACEDRLDPPDLFLEEEEFLDDLEVAAISGYLEFNGSINSSFSRTTAQNGVMSEGMQRRVDWQWL